MEEMEPGEVNEIMAKLPLSNIEQKEALFVPGKGGLSIVLRVGLFSALGGGLFGLDIGYIAGVENMESFLNDVNEGKKLDSLIEGAVTGIFALGAVVAAFPSIITRIVNKLGRKGTIIFGGALFCVGALIQALSPSLNVMYVGRFLAGASVGALSATIPVYQGEIAPPEYRGAIVALYQLAITIGICVAFWINYALENVEHGWRYSILFQVLPGALLATGGFFMPRSPRWLVSRRRYDDAFDTIIRIRGPDQDCRVELAQIYKEFRRQMAHGKPTWKEFFSGTNGKILAVGILMQMIQQMCGLNLFMYYGPHVFDTVFHSKNAAFLFSAFSGIVNFLSTFPALALVDKAGRMKLLRWSAVGMFISCVLLASVGGACFETTADAKPMDGQQCGDWAKYTVAGSVFFFIFNFAYGWGPVVWVYCAEIFPLKYKTKAVGLTTDANWVGNFFIGFAPPWLMDTFGFKTFWMFAFINLLGVAAGFLLPETKGKSLEQVQVMFEMYFKGETGFTDGDALCNAEDDSDWNSVDSSEYSKEFE